MTTENETTLKSKTQTPDEIIATRKSCDAEGTGLSHYILMDKKPSAGKTQ